MRSRLGRIIVCAALTFHCSGSLATEAPSRSLSCEPSPDCALTLALEWGRAGGGEAYLFTLSTLLPVVARYGSRTDLDALLQQWSMQFQALRGPVDQVPIAPAEALAIAGRVDEAIERAKSSRSADLSEAATTAVVAALVDSGKLKEGADAWRALTAENARALSARKLLPELESVGDPHHVREFVTLLGFDPDAASGPALTLVLRSDIARGDFDAATRLAASSDDPVGWRVEIARAQADRQDTSGATATLRQAARHLSEVRDTLYRRELLLAVINGFVAARAPREALLLVDGLPGEARSGALAEIVEQLAVADLRAARGVAARIPDRHAYAKWTATEAVVSASIASDPSSREGLERISYPRLKGLTLARAALALAPRAPDAARPLLAEAILLINSDPDIEGRDLSWSLLAEALADTKRFDEAYAIAERIGVPEYRIRIVSELARGQYEAGDRSAAQGRMSAALSQARREAQAPTHLARAALHATQVGLHDQAFEVLHGLRSRKDTDRNRDEPELFEAKLATAVALAEGDPAGQALALALAVDTEYQGDRVFAAVYRALAERARVSLPKQ